MHLSYPLLASAAALWFASSWVVPSSSAPPTRPPVLGVAGSAYGSLMARSMRDSLFSYWHEGESSASHNHEEHDKDNENDKEHGAGAPNQAAVDGLRKRLNLPKKPPVEKVVESDQPWLERLGERLEGLEASRFKRNSPFAVSSVHRRYMNAAALWRLRLAYHLDPGDVVLYEILYAQTASQKGAPQANQALAEQAVARALLPGAGFSEALTGAGAIVNVLNEALVPDQVAKLDHARAAQKWKAMEQCLLRYRQLRETAVSEGWWEGIPEARRKDLDGHAALLTKLSSNLREQLVQKGAL